MTEATQHPDWSLTTRALMDLYLESQRQRILFKWEQADSLLIVIKISKQETTDVNHSLKFFFSWNP